MADVLHKTTKQYLSSVNTPDYLDGNWLINPDMSVVAGYPQKFWIIEDNALRLATVEEQHAISTNERYLGMDVEAVKALINSDINAFRDNIINDGVIFMGHLFDSDSRARENIVGMCSAIGLGVPFPANFTWRSRMNADVPMNAAKLTTFGAGVLTYVSTCFAVSWHHKDTMNAMVSSDVADYIGYDYTIGWPSKSIDGSTLA